MKKNFCKHEYFLKNNCLLPKEPHSIIIYTMMFILYNIEIQLLILTRQIDESQQPSKRLVWNTCAENISANSWSRLGY